MSLRDRFYTPADVVADLQWVRGRLLDPAAPDDERSHGRVTSDELFHRWSGSGRRPARGGIFCQRIFGPVNEFCCACGRVCGAEHAGVTCERCGVLCTAADARQRRHGHLEVAGVLHPALAPVVAQALRLAPEQVLAVARCQAWLDGDVWHALADTDTCEDPETTGLVALVAALERVGADPALVELAITRAVPVPPPGLRPFAGDLGPAMVDPWIGPLNEAWRTFLLAANQQLRLLEIGVPPIIDMHAQRRVQERFEALVRWTASPPASVRPWPEPAPLVAPVRLMGPPGRLPDEVGSEVVGLLFVDEERLFVQRPQASWLVNLAGEVLARFPTCGRIATSVHGSRLRMPQWIRHEWDWFGQDEYWDAKSGRASVAVLELQTGEYLDTYPADLPLRSLEHDQPEELVPVSVDGDALSGPLRWGGDRPGTLATTRDGRFAWVGEQDATAVLDLDTGLPLLDPVMESRVDEEDPVVRLSPDAPDVRDEADAGEAATALGLTPQQRFRFLHGTGVVSDGERLWFRVDAMILAAAFSPAADRLAIATDEEIVVIAVSDRPAIVGRFAAPQA
ncbi:hypothetical protein [Nannocystis punicea]|uniref:DNA-directed RNA polymerase n=1 Tax=Nannocystis punicea TaxID=2995304 RepID=A0ABY7H980_9BACT|nr:hypothetical protein [Nannocystis poenicansa]WAS95544.1 hypothetical protein O0S08_05225 [Nannocystis poenicansa]